MAARTSATPPSNCGRHVKRPRKLSTASTGDSLGWRIGSRTDEEFEDAMVEIAIESCAGGSDILLGMLDPEILRLAASGLLPPEVIARLAGMTEAELRVRHGTEIAAQRQVRGDAVRRLLDIGTDACCATLLTLDADDREAAGLGRAVSSCPG